MQITGAQLFVKALQAEQVDTLFAYPGGQAIDLFDALYGAAVPKVILPRHEQGLVHAADGYARSTGKTGVCLVTSGPGATNLVTGIATANYDSVPLVCFTGQVPTGLIGNDSFQEVNIVGITRSITKYAVTVRRREELGSVIKKAFYIAVDIPVVADAKSAISTLLEKAEPLPTGEWLAQLERWKQQHPLRMKPSALSPQAILQAVNHCFEDAIIATDVGQNQLWATQFLALDEHRRLLTSGGLGTMGYGLPAAIGASLGNPRTDVLVITGDGGMQMNLQELATAVVYELPVIICIFTTAVWGMCGSGRRCFIRDAIPPPACGTGKAALSPAPAPGKTVLNIRRISSGLRKAMAPGASG